MERSSIISDLKPRVSIGIPVFNGATFLAETIDCLLSQSFGDFEIVISDNASTDSTEAICNSYMNRDPRVRYERQSINRGGPWNYNRVFELSRGTYFKWAAHDDLFSTTFLARCVDVLDFNPSIAWCQARVGLIDRLGRAVETSGCELSGAAEVLIQGEGNRPHLPDSSTMRFAHQRFRKVLLGNHACLDIYGLIRSDVLRKTSLYEPYFGGCKVLIGALSLRGKCAEIPEVLFFFRIHEEACSAKETIEVQSTWANPDESCSKLNGMVRLQILKGYVRNVFQAPIGLWSRAICLFGIGAYLLQFRKWRSIMLQILGNKALGSGTRKALKKLEEVETSTVV